MQHLIAAADTGQSGVRRERVAGKTRWFILRSGLRVSLGLHAEITEAGGLFRSEAMLDGTNPRSPGESLSCRINGPPSAKAIILGLMVFAASAPAT